jgi:hypothetical protein
VTRYLTLLAFASISVVSLSAADLSPAAAALDRQLKGVEGEVVSLVEAMPDDKFTFAPTNGEFKGVRTFAQQAKHIAAVNYQVCAALLGEKSPVEVGSDENGPATVQTKAQVVDLVKKSYEYAHKAIATLTAENLMGNIQDPFGNRQVPRLTVATVPTWHSFDHYGQMVVYARMNGIVPPASRPRPPAAKK